METRVTQRKRKRSTARTFLNLVMILVAAYLLSAAWIWSRRPTISFDPVARMQELTPRAEPGKDAWSAYKSALHWMHAGAEKPGFDLSETLNLTLTADPGTPMWATVAPMVDAHRAEVDSLRTAAAMPTFGYVPQIDHHPEDLEYFGLPPTLTTEPLEQEFPSVAITLPYLSELHAAGRLLRLDALLAAERGRGSQAVDSVAAIVNVSRHVSQLPVLVGSLVQDALLTMAAQTAVAAIALKPAAFKQADLKRLDEIFAEVTPESTRIHLEGERVMMEDVLQRLFTDDGAGNGSIVFSRLPMFMGLVFQGPDGTRSERTPSAFTLFITCPLHAAAASDRAEIRRLWNGALTEASAQSVLPEWKQDFPAEREIESSALRERSEYMPVVLLTPAISHAARTASRARMYPAMARVHLALERFHREKDRWPATLDELVPNFMQSVPRDEFADAPLQYGVANGKPRVWGAGKNQHNYGEPEDIAISR